MRAVTLLTFLVCLGIILAQTQEITEIQYDDATFASETQKLLLSDNPRFAPAPGTRLVITATKLNIREKATTSSKILATLSNGQTVTFTGQVQRADDIVWWGVQGSPFGKGFAASQYLRADSNNGNPGVAVSRWALQQVGKGYTQRQCPAQCCRLGPNCFDCSGLTYIGWKQAGYTIPISTHGYNSNTMQVVSRNNLREGDMLWRTGHVGMYVGNGVMVEAANPTKGVIRSTLANFKYTHIYRPKNTLNVTAVHH